MDLEMLKPSGLIPFSPEELMKAKGLMYAIAFISFVLFIYFILR